MTIYYLGEREIYIDKIAEFIVANYHSKLSDLKVIVPNTLACFELQKALLKKIGVATLLPNIMPINFITQESDISYNIP
ncbi:MAG: hypothetical protein KA998_01855, partial [Rickettsiaceae bacterium]|nr:hypothetical protein [Rickettsiaceae bacterium]